MKRTRRTFGKQARQAGVWCLALFLVGQVVAGLLLDYAFPDVKSPLPNKIADRVARLPDKPTIVFLGSSRTGAAVAEADGNAVLTAAGSEHRIANAGIIATDAVLYEGIYDKLLARGVKPKWLVLEVSPETLTTPLPFMRETAVRRLDWSHLAHLPAIVESRAGWVYLESRLQPVYAHRRELVVRMKSPFKAAEPVTDRDAPGTPKIAPLPAPPLPSDELQTMSRVGSATVVRKWLKNYRVGGLASEGLESLLARCKAEGVGVILLNIPQCTAHRAEVTPAIDSAYRGHLNDLCQRHGARFIDAADWVPDGLYVDALHLRGEEGAKWFTRKFITDVVPTLHPR